MPEKHPVVKLRERFETLGLSMSHDLEHLHYLQVILVVCGSMSVSHIVFKHDKLFCALFENLYMCGSERKNEGTCTCICTEKEEEGEGEEGRRKEWGWGESGERERERERE